MEMLKETVIAKALELHPKAENSVEALDLYAQDIYKGISMEDDVPFLSEEAEKEVELYHIIRAVRDEEIAKQINELSSYQIKDGTNG